MTFEQRLVERIRTDGIGSLLGDEELTGLAKRAIEKALFEPRPNPDTSWNAVKFLPSPIMKAADDLAKQMLPGLIEVEAKRLFGDPRNQVVIRTALMAMLPSMLEGVLYRNYQALSAQATNDAVDALKKLAEESGA